MPPPVFLTRRACPVFITMWLVALSTAAAPALPERPASFPLSRPSVVGELVAWGSNAFGQVTIPPGATNVVAIAAGFFHSLALRANGTVVAWGDNTKGQCN